MISERCRFKDVWGIPSGGTKLRNALSFYCQDDNSLPTLIVDDVLTTGQSMEETRHYVHGDVIGYVVFARGECPDWIKALFYME
jgi:RIO-like serine/threonine protein kinase